METRKKAGALGREIRGTSPLGCICIQHAQGWWEKEDAFPFALTLVIKHLKNIGIPEAHLIKGPFSTWLQADLHLGLWGPQHSTFSVPISRKVGLCQSVVLP